MNDSVDAIDKLRDEIKELRDRNKKAVKNLPAHAELAVLKNDTDYLRLGVYGLGIALLALGGWGWSLYTHIDEELNHKVDYMNARIDTLFISAIPTSISVKPQNPIGKNK